MNHAASHLKGHSIQLVVQTHRQTHPTHCWTWTRYGKTQSGQAIWSSSDAEIEDKSRVTLLSEYIIGGDGEIKELL